MKDTVAPHFEIASGTDGVSIYWGCTATRAEEPCTGSLIWSGTGEQARELLDRLSTAIWYRKE
jgi:hypothetical protein